MKKNKMMRLASTMMVLTLMTTSVISGTFAKYVTSDEASDEARVAKWGVTVVANGSLYGEKYASSDNKITALDTNDAVSVWGKQATGINKVVAPGTESDEGFHFALNGKPEVDAIVKMTVEHENIFLGTGTYGVMVEVEGVTEDNFVHDVGAGKVLYTRAGSAPDFTYTEAAGFDEGVTAYYELHDKAIVGAEGYWPVVYSMSGETIYSTGDCEEDTLKIIADMIVKKLDDTKETGVIPGEASHYKVENVQKNIEQNEDFNIVMNLGSIDLSWIWAFDNGYDEQDTILGNLMAERIGSADWKGDVVMFKDDTSYIQPVEGTNFGLNAKFDINITVEQID